MPTLQYLVIEWLLPLAMVPFVARRRRPFPAIAWLGFIFAVPLFGIPLYLLIGEYGLRRRRRKHRKPERLVAAGEIEPDDLSEAVRPFARAVHGLAEDRDVPAPILAARSFELLVDMAAVERMIGDIGAAREHVNLLFFIYADDETGWRVARALAEAAARGVECRLLMDAHGSKKAWRSIRPWLVERGVSVDRSLKISLFENPVRRVDVRNHRKIAVIDGCIGYTGSMNVHDEDFDLDRGTWSQITARLEGAAVARLQQVFLHDWRVSSGEQVETDRFLPPASHDSAAHALPAPTAPGSVPSASVPSMPDGTDEPDQTRIVPVQVLEDGPSYGCDSIQPMFVDLLHGARERLVLTTPYFVPDQPVLLAVRLAALRGVDVEIYLPRKSDRGLADAAARAVFEELLRAGVKVFRHQAGVLHAKTVSVDDRIAVIGTANLDYRSFFLNYEVVVIVHDPSTVIGLRKLQQAYGEHCEQIDLDAWRDRPRRDQVVDDVARLFSPLL